MPYVTKGIVLILLVILIILGNVNSEHAYDLGCNYGHSEIYNICLKQSGPVSEFTKSELESFALEDKEDMVNHAILMFMFNAVSVILVVIMVVWLMVVLMKSKNNSNG